MAASLFMFGFLFLCLTDLSSPYPQVQSDDDFATANDTTAIPPAVQCTTARGLAGNCLDRQYCDYSTYAIDLSLYAPKDFKKSCGDKETCCPVEFQLTIEPKNMWSETNFDENDK